MIPSSDEETLAWKGLDNFIYSFNIYLRGASPVLGASQIWGHNHKSSGASVEGGQAANSHRQT